MSFQTFKVFLFLIIPFGFFTLAAAQPVAEVVQNKVMVKYKPGTDKQTREQIEQRHSLSQVSEIKLFSIHVYEFDAKNATADDLCNKLHKEPAIDIATPDHVRAASSVNDTEFNKQWYLNNTGQNVNGKSGPPDIDIRWKNAQNIYNPKQKIKVAVVDSGVNMLHPEIVGQINFDFNYDYYSLDEYPFDENGHGTLVAGIICSSINNQTGVSGITNSVELISYRVFDQFGRSGTPKYRVGGTSVSDTLLALAAAVNSGAKIINLSLGGLGYNQLEKDAYDSLIQHNVIAVIAAGNGGEDGRGDNNDSTPTYPASYPSDAIISVAALQRNGGLSNFSNYGVNSVDIAAPGEDIYGPDVTRRTIFYENFDGGASGWNVGRNPGDASFTNWAIDTYDGINGFLTDRLYGSTYYSGTDTWVKSPLISLTNTIGSRLEFDSYLSIGDDWLVVEVSDDGYNWYADQYFYGLSTSGYSLQQVDISHLDGYSGYFRFRFVSNYYYNDYGILIDNFKISGVDLVNSSGAKYQYNNGTSFAAPIVAGAAAMIWTHRPDLSAQKVREILLQSGRSIDLLSGKISTGKMVDAHAALLLASSQPVLDLPPSITSQPASVSVTAGASASFSVSANGTSPSYQWYKNGSPISGATGASYTIPSAQASDAGNYTVTVFNTAGSVSSNTATLTVNSAPPPPPVVTAPSITSQPTSVSVTAGASASFSVSAAGTSPSYQWYKDGNAISGATGASHTISNAQASDAGSYSVLVSNSAGSVSSNAATLTVAPPPVSITSDLSTVSVPIKKLIPRFMVTTNFGAKTFAAKRLPKGLKLNTKTGVISGKPTKKGTYTVTLTARKMKGKKVEQQATATKVYVVY
jgi:hypothetical protein